MSDPTITVREFVARINRHDLPGLLQFATSDHRFIDAAGVVVTGRDELRAAWQGYFRMVPDYWIAIDKSLAQNDIVLLVGRAGGTYAPDGLLSPARRWQVPAAWRAVVRADRVAEWQVYADNEPLRAVMWDSGEPTDGENAT